MPVLHCYRYLPRSALDRLEMIVIGAWLDVEIGKDDLPRLLCRQCLNHHRAQVNGGFHLFERAALPVIRPLSRQGHVTALPTLNGPGLMVTAPSAPPWAAAVSVTDSLTITGNGAKGYVVEEDFRNLT
jgi:hypothetical protein